MLYRISGLRDCATIVTKITPNEGSQRDWLALVEL